MPKITCPLEEGGKDRLEIAWTGPWICTTVKVDDEIYGIFFRDDELKTGHNFELEDGSILHIQLIQRGLKNELQILMDGEPVTFPSSIKHPFTRSISHPFTRSKKHPFTSHKVAYSILFFIAGLNIILGLLSVLLENAFPPDSRIGPGSILYGVGFLILGYYTKRRSAFALTLATLIFFIDSLISLEYALVSGILPNTTLVIGRIFLLISMFQGIKAIPDLPPE